MKLKLKHQIIFSCYFLFVIVSLTSRQATGQEKIIIGPDYQIDPDLTDLGNPKGNYFEFTMRLADSKIFRGDDSTLDPKKQVRDVRKIFVYIPAAYKNGAKAPILVTFDGPSRLNLVRNALDNLTISKAVSYTHLRAHETD